ncbi:MAG: flagellar motor switch protein FliN [Phycisphaeraceae bacterium]|nr:flagellar motor switch protein FliN [Phycisphaeraceae bacterium]
MAEETPTPNQPTPESASTPPDSSTPPVSEQAEEALDAAQAAVSSLAGDVGTRGPGVVSGAAGGDAKPVDLPAFSGGTGNGAPASIDLLSDVSLQVKIELGRTRMLVEDVLRLADGAVVELDKLAGDPVDIYVNERHVARGEVLVLNDNFCVRINEILESPLDAKQPVKQAG